MTKFATIILNRNLPNITDKLYRRIKKDNDTDIFVVESGSKKKNYSKYATWVADWQSAKKNGLRFPRGMNFGLSNLWKENKFVETDEYKCSKCKQRRCTYYTLQTRSCDEPETIIITCLNCNYGWKE